MSKVYQPKNMVQIHGNVFELYCICTVCTNLSHTSSMMTAGLCLLFVMYQSLSTETN